MQSQKTQRKLEQRFVEVSCSFLVHLSYSQVFSVNYIFEIQNFVIL